MDVNLTTGFIFPRFSVLEGVLNLKVISLFGGWSFMKLSLMKMIARLVMIFSALAILLL